MKERKYKVGDKVTVISSDILGYERLIGTIVTISEIDKTGKFPYRTIPSGWFGESELRLLTPLEELL